MSWGGVVVQPASLPQETMGCHHWWLIAVCGLIALCLEPCNAQMLNDQGPIDSSKRQDAHGASVDQEPTDAADGSFPERNATEPLDEYMQQIQEHWEQCRAQAAVYLATVWRFLARGFKPLVRLLWALVKFVIGLVVLILAGVVGAIVYCGGLGPLIQTVIMKAGLFLEVCVPLRPLFFPIARRAVSAEPVAL